MTTPTIRPSAAPVMRAAPAPVSNSQRSRLRLRNSCRVGIVFSVVLIAVQFGLYLGSEVRIAAMLDQAKGDLWVVPFGTKSFDDPTFLEGKEKHAILSTPGIASVEELAAGFVAWRRPSGGITAALLVGSDINTNTTLPWD